MDSSRSHDPRLYRAQPGPGYPPAAQRQGEQYPPRRTSPSVYPYEQQPTSSAYPYEQSSTRSPTQQPQFAQARRSPAPRRLLGVLAFLVLTALSLPVHIAAIFFVWVEFESPGDPAMAALLIGGTFVASFGALFVTGLLTQVVGRFPGRWRARATFAALSGAVALGIAYFAALNLV